MAFDPFSLDDPHGLFSAMMAANQPASPAGQRPNLPALAPEEEESLLSKLGSKALGGLGYVGSVLEKATGGRAIRGLLGGKPRELLSILPGSDTFGITDEADRVSGKQLLGLENEEGILPTIAGIGTEIALDPATYLSFGAGALTKGGKVAKAAGLLPETIAGRAGTTLAEVLGSATPEIRAAAEAAAQKLGTSIGELAGQRLGGVAGLGLPFMDPSVIFGASDAGVNLVNKVGQAANYLGHVSPLKYAWEPLQSKVLDPLQRYATAWFDPSVMGATTREGQEAAREASATTQGLRSAAQTRLAGYAEDLAQAGVGGGRGAELRQVVEGVASPIERAAGEPLNQIGGKLAGDYKQELDELQKVGVDIRPLADDYAQFASRQQSKLPGEGGGLGRPSRPLQATDPRVTAREEILKNIPGGTEAINQMVADTAVSGSARTLTNAEDAARHIGANYLGLGADAQQRLQELRGMNLEQVQHMIGMGPEDREMLQQLMAEKAGLEDKFGQAKKLADWLGELDPRYAAEQHAFFGNHPLADAATYFDRTARMRGAAEAVHNLVAKTALPGGGALPEGAVPLTDALKRAGLDFQVANQDVGGLSYLAKKMGVGVDELQKMAVPESTVGEISRFMRGFTQPESVSPVLAGFDYLTGLTKAFQTAPWPAHHLRNFVTGLWQNLVKGGFEPGLDPINGFLKPLQDAKNLVGGGVIADANLIPGLTHLSPEEATRALGREMYGQGVFGFGKANFTRDTEKVGTTLEDILAQIPGRSERGFGAVGEALKEGSWNPAKALSDAESFAPVKAGRELGDLVEGVNRGSLYLALRRQGYDAAQAAKEVLAAHFDYSASGLTSVEKNVFKRLMPFYSYTRNNIPFALEQLIQHPGGLVGTEAKVAASLRAEQGGFLPDYLTSTLALPIGKEEDGTQRYLTKLDLPPEQAFDLIGGGAHPVQDTALGALANLNPLIKGPLELATGKQFYSGRELGDLHQMFPDLPGGLALEQALMNSPISRFLTTGRTLADERKWASPTAALAQPLNLLTGARVSDVDLEKAKSIAARDYITEALRGQQGVGSFETLYPRAGAQLTPEEIALLRLNKTLEEQAAQKRKIGMKK